jgi:hypothetical protein
MLNAVRLPRRSIGDIIAITVRCFYQQFAIFVHSQTVASGVVGSDQVVLDREAGGRVARGHVQLGVDRGQVAIDGARADDQLCGDISIGKPPREQAQHRDLALGQAGGISR